MSIYCIGLMSDLSSDLRIILKIKCINALLLLGEGIFLSKLHLDEKKSQIVSEVVAVLWLFKMDSVL